MAQNITDNIYQTMASKALLKQHLYKQNKAIFAALRAACQQLESELEAQLKRDGISVPLELKKINNHEFHFKIGSDVLVYSLPTNIITFQPEYIIMKNTYIQEDPNRSFFGQILCYNFMADSIKYHRLQDPGYLVSRLLINHEQHFFVEGVDQLNFMYPDIAKNKVTAEWLRSFVEKTVQAAVDIDLMGAPFANVQAITLGAKMQDSMSMGSGNKVGFTS